MGNNRLLYNQLKSIKMGEVLKITGGAIGL
jgi:hypothetical protein